MINTTQNKLNEAAGDAVQGSGVVSEEVLVETENLEVGVEERPCLALHCHHHNDLHYGGQC